MAAPDHAPDSLKYQWRLYALVSRSDWATGLDKSIAFEIIDNYRKDFKKSRASLGYLQEATGAKRSNVVASIRRLCEHGPFSVARQGIGTRPTEYTLHFDLVAENLSSPVEATTSNDHASSPVEGTTGSPVEATTSASSSPVEGTQTVLRTRLTAGVQEDGNINSPDPLPAAGLAATAAVSRGPENAFYRFWQATPRKYQKPKARAAWDKLSPDPELAKRIIAAAGDWAAHYEANPVEKKWMPAPANWLAGERYDEDLPSVYVDAKEAAIAKKKDRPAKTPAKSANPEPFTERRETFTILEASLNEEGTSKWLDLALQTDDGAGDDMTICLESHNESAQQKGQNQLDRITSAAGLASVDDPSELVGAKFVRVLRSKFAEFEYEPVAGNDNRPFGDTVIVDDITPKKVRPAMPRFADVVARTKFEGWAAKLGTAYDDDDEEEAA